MEKNTNANNANASNNTNANAYADADANTKSTNKTPKQNFSFVSNLDTMGLRDIKTRIFICSLVRFHQTVKRSIDNELSI